MSSNGGGGSNLLDMGLLVAAGVAAPEVAGAIAPELMGAGGVGAAAMGAATGAGISGLTAAATGQNALRAAEMGALGGAVTGYMPDTPTLPSGANPPVEMAPVNTPMEGVPPPAVNPPVTPPPSTGNMLGNANIFSNAGTTPANAQLYTSAGINALGGLSQRPAGAYTPPGSIYTGGNLQKFKYDPNNYQPDVVVPPNPLYHAQYAEGGITSLRKGGVAHYDGGGPIPQSMANQAVQQMLAQNGKSIPASSSTNSNPNQFATPISAPAGYTMNEYGEYVPNQSSNMTNFMGLSGPEMMQIIGHNGMAAGGVASGKSNSSDMDMIEKYMSDYQSDPASVKSAAQNGDYNAMIALNKINDTPNQNYASGGGISDLGSYSDGGRLLKGPGDGMSDDIPAKIGHKQEARLADGEFVVSSDVVSGLGNGSTDAGARHLYKMMDKVRHARTGRKAQGKQIKAEKYLPA